MQTDWTKPTEVQQRHRTVPHWRQSQLKRKTKDAHIPSYSTGNTEEQAQPDGHSEVGARPLSAAEHQGARQSATTNRRPYQDSNCNTTSDQQEQQCMLWRA